MKPSEIKQILADGDIRLTKSLGQNFLHDGNQLRRIVAAADLRPLDNALEIGPGLGPLTQRLLAHARQVLAIEKDLRLVHFLRQRFASSPGLALVHDDALEFIRREIRDWSAWKLVANLPYSVASPILVELAQSGGRPERMVVTLQLEVAKRLTARPGEDDYGLLTLLLQLHYEPRGWFKIPASCFFPPPAVDSACVTLVRRSQPLLNDAEAETFGRIAKRAFSQRRKMMLKLLKEDWPEEELAAALDRLGIAKESRAEMIELRRFVELARHLHPYDRRNL